MEDRPDWLADIETARWSGGDLAFEADYSGRRLSYAIAIKALSGDLSAPASKVLAANLPALRDALRQMSKHGGPGVTLRLN